MRIVHSVSDFRALRPTLGRLAFVPTMGNLHEGHISLVRAALEHADRVAASIFVNRLQFGPAEDFSRYPRTLAEDAAKLEEAGVDVLFAPDEDEMYPAPQTYHVEPPASQVGILEGEFRAGHFRGVATVVMKLFQIVQPDIALFGKKDYQQLMVLRNMVAQFAVPVAVVGCDTIRADDGLALSSRNGYLSTEERRRAPQLHEELQHIRQEVLGGNREFDELQAAATTRLDAGGWRTEYVRICRRVDLQAAEPAAGEALVVLAAARLGTTRLIDNVEI
ncbi:MAG: pantoate--beta-alanine ligase [Rhodocyclaceae bacterium]|nr:pantoate--beta-alanine ligase [Rhodocyclaceae bacterium]